MYWSQILSILGIIAGLFGAIFSVIQNRRLEDYKRKMNEKSEVFKTKKDIFLNFMKEEFLSSGQTYENDGKVKETLKHYGQIGLVGEISTLKALIEGQNGDFDSESEDSESIIEWRSNVISSMRKELSGTDEKDQEDVIRRYSKLLLQLSSKEISDKTKSEISISGDYKLMSLGELVSLHSGLHIDKQYIQPGKTGDPVYLKIRDISSFNQISGEIISKKALPENIQKKEIIAHNIFIISAIGTIGKTCYLNDGRRILISSSLNYGEIQTRAINGEYLSIVFRTSFVISQLKYITRGVAQPFMSIRGLQDIQIPVFSPQQQYDLVQNLNNENINERAKKIDKLLGSKN